MSLYGCAKDESVPCGLELAVLAQIIAVRIVEVAVVVECRCGRPARSQPLEIFAIRVRQQIWVALVLEVKRCHSKVKLLAPEAVEERLDVLPITFRQRCGGLSPAAWCGDEVKHGLVARVRDVVPDALERSVELVSRQYGTGRRLLAQEARPLPVDGRELDSPFGGLAAHTRRDAAELARILGPSKARQCRIKGIGHGKPLLANKRPRPQHVDGEAVQRHDAQISQTAQGLGPPPLLVLGDGQTCTSDLYPRGGVGEQIRCTNWREFPEGLLLVVARVSQ